MSRLVIVGCGAAKRDEPSTAKNLYTSTYFRKKREYAESLGDFWAILSAEHGLIEPAAEIAPYDTTIADLSEEELDELAHSVGMQLIDWIAGLRGAGVVVDEIVVLAGKSYLDPLRERDAFSAGLESRVTFPLQQHDLGGIGEQMAWLSDRVDAAGEQSQLVTDGGREKHGDVADRWEQKAEENVEEWGEQSIETLLLAAQEELGELTQAALEYRAEDGYYESIFHEIDDLGALLIQIHNAANGHRFRNDDLVTDGGSPATDSERDLDGFEEKMDELNAGLLEAYCAGFSEAARVFDADPDFETTVDALQEHEQIRQAHFYYWDGRTKPLSFWLREHFGLQEVDHDE